MCKGGLESSPVDVAVIRAAAHGLIRTDGGMAALHDADTSLGLKADAGRSFTGPARVHGLAASSQGPPMGRQPTNALREYMGEFRSCIKQGDFLEGSQQVAQGCFGSLRGRLEESRTADNVAVASTAQTRTQELQRCLMECEIFHDDTSHVTFGCFNRLKKCRQSAELEGGLLAARGHIVELTRLVDELVPFQ